MAAFMRYLNEDLKYTSNLRYYMGGHRPLGVRRSGPGISERDRVAPARDGEGSVPAGDGRRRLLRHGDAVRNAEYTFTHLGFDKTDCDRVQFKYYESGHMAYLNQASAKQLKSDIAHFIQSTEHFSPLEMPAANSRWRRIAASGRAVRQTPS